MIKLDCGNENTLFKEYFNILLWTTLSDMKTNQFGSSADMSNNAK